MGSFLNKPKKTLILRNANFDCPSKEGAIPKVNQQIFNGVTSESDCQTRCRKTQECSYYEWHKLDGQNDFCVLFEHLTLEEGHPESVSGLTKCNSFKNFLRQIHVISKTADQSFRRFDQNPCPQLICA